MIIAGAGSAGIETTGICYLPDGAFSYQNAAED